MTTQENLLRLMNLPLSRFDAVCRTSDGFYLAQVRDDLGYNAFLGNPAPPHNGPGRDAMLAVWNSLTAAEREAVWSLAAHPWDGSPIPLDADFGVPRIGES